MQYIDVLTTLLCDNLYLIFMNNQSKSVILPDTCYLQEISTPRSSKPIQKCQPTRLPSVLLLEYLLAVCYNGKHGFIMQQ